MHMAALALEITVIHFLSQELKTIVHNYCECSELVYDQMVISLDTFNMIIRLWKTRLFSMNPFCFIIYESMIFFVIINGITLILFTFQHDLNVNHSDQYGGFRSVF